MPTSSGDLRRTCLRLPIFVLVCSGSDLPEPVRRVFMNAFMLRVVECFKGVSLAMGLSFVGSLGSGKVDYIIHYLRHWMVVTEAKKDDFSSIAETLIQMRSVAEVC